MEIYCVKCKAKTETRDLAEVTMKNGKPAAQGSAPSAAPRSSASDGWWLAPADRRGSTCDLRSAADWVKSAALLLGNAGPPAYHAHVRTYSSAHKRR